MTQRSRAIWIGFVALAATTLALQGSRGAEGEKGANKEIQAIADAVQKGSEADVKKLTTKFLKDHEDDPVFDAMLTMKPTDYKVPGFPFGKAGLPDGIEKAIQEISKNGIKPDDLKKNAADFETLANRVIAISYVAQATKQKKNNDLWKTYSNKMNELSQDFAKAIKANDPAGVQGAAKKLDANCNQCHEKFR